MSDQRRPLYKEFQGTIFFLVKFIGLYVAGSLLYGVYITAFEPQADPVTNVVTRQASSMLNAMGYNSIAYNHQTKPTTYLEWNGKRIVSVYEGCNGLNVMVVFLSFIFAFGPINRRSAWFVPLSLVIIHLSNLARIIFLFLAVIYFPRYQYFLHKYFFTAFIYLVVLGLWLWWVKKNGKK